MPEHLAGPTLAPLFCPACRRPGEPDQTLCRRCGDALRPRGYCPVCEGWAQATPGAPCPKHDVELEERPTARDPDRSTTPMVTVATFGMPAEARGPQLRLEAEGIPVFLDGERMAENVIYGVATGGVRLQVPADLADDARVLLAQSWSPPKDADDLDDPWEGLAPDPAQRRKSLMKTLILVFLFGPLVFSLIGFLLRSLAH